MTKKKQTTLIKEPKWSVLSKSSTEEQRLEAFAKCEDFVHYEVSEKEQLNALKKWLRNESGWDVHEQTVILPDTYLISFAKHGWKALKLGFMPESTMRGLENSLLPLLRRAQELKDKMYYEPNIHPDISVKDEEDPLNLDNIKEWLGKWNSFLRNNKHYADSKDPELRRQYQAAENYVYNLKTYVRSGVWLDSKWGEDRENQMYFKCYAMAYNADGTAKRTKGVWYADIRDVWSEKYE